MENCEIVDEKQIDEYELMGTRTFYVKMQDGHDYIILRSWIKCNGIHSSIIHAVGCRKCLENKNKDSNN